MLNDVFFTLCPFLSFGQSSRDTAQDFAFETPITNLLALTAISKLFPAWLNENSDKCKESVDTSGQSGVLIVKEVLKLKDSRS